MKNVFGISLLLICSSGISVSAQPVDPETIVTAISSRGVIVIEQPAALNGRLINNHTEEAVTVVETAVTPQPGENSEASISNTTTDTPVTPAVKTAGYRVQVFSDNNVRTAKSEARAKAQAISARLPQYRTYVAYNSPFWRLRVGDFPTLSEAENAADEIKKIFPAYAQEVRVVKDRINRQ